MATGRGEDDLSRVVDELSKANEAYHERETLMKREIERLAGELAELRTEKGARGGLESPTPVVRQSEGTCRVPISERPRKDMSLQSMVASWAGIHPRHRDGGLKRELGGPR